MEAIHGYGVLVFNLGSNHCLWRLGCRRDDRCGLALDALGNACGHSRLDKPLWVGSGRQDRLGNPPVRLPRHQTCGLRRDCLSNRQTSTSLAVDCGMGCLVGHRIFVGEIVSLDRVDDHEAS
jgi:hypothetical protein